MAEKRKFSDWFENVFWFHYRWRMVAAVFLLALIGFSAFQLLRAPAPDLTVVYARHGDSTLQVSELQNRIKAAYEASTGEHGARIRLIEVKADANVPAQSSEGLLYAYLKNPDIALFITDDSYMTLYSSLGYFENSIRLSDGLNIAVYDYPIAQVTNKTKYYEKFSQSELDDVNAENQAKHQAQIDLVRAVAERLGQS